MTSIVTVIGNTTADVELRFTQGGHAVASFTVASTERIFDRQSDEWKDGKKLFMRCTAWRDLAEHIAASAQKGTRVVVVGKISTRQYETKEGERRSSTELEVEEFGVSLRYATAQLTRTSGGNAGKNASEYTGGNSGGQARSFGGGQQAGQQQQGWYQPDQQPPAASTTSEQPTFNDFDEPPF